MRMGREAGIFLWKNNCHRQPAKKFENRLRVEESVCEFFYGSSFPETSVLEIDNSKYYVLHPPFMYFDIDDHFILSQKSVLVGDSQY